MDGQYDINGKCVRCKKYHPCNCEISSYDEHLITEVQREAENQAEKFDDESGG